MALCLSPLGVECNEVVVVFVMFFQRICMKRKLF